MTIGERIRQARKEAKLTQIEAAQKIGIAVNTLRLYESGKRQPRLEQLEKIAEALDIQFRDFFPKEQHEIMGYMYRAGFEEHAAEFEDIIEGYTFSQNERDMISHFCNLNSTGQREAVKRVEELTEIPKYRRQDAPETPPSSPEGTDTTPPKKPPESL